MPHSKTDKKFRRAMSDVKRWMKNPAIAEHLVSSSPRMVMALEEASAKVYANIEDPRRFMRGTLTWSEVLFYIAWVVASVAGIDLPTLPAGKHLMARRRLREYLAELGLAENREFLRTMPATTVSREDMERVYYDLTKKGFESVTDGDIAVRLAVLRLMGREEDPLALWPAAVCFGKGARGNAMLSKATPMRGPRITANYDVKKASDLEFAAMQAALGIK